MNGWPTALLGDVAEIERAIVAPEAIDSGTRYVGLEHITSDGYFNAPPLVDAGELASAKFAFGASHVLYGKLRPYLSKIARPDFSGVCSTDILPIRAGSRLDRDYLHHFLRQPEMVALAASRSSGANLPRLSPGVLAEFSIPVPPLGEQRRIAEVLDRAETLRVQRRQALAQLDALAEAIFLDMFGDPDANSRGWQTSTISDIAEQVTDGEHLTPKREVAGIKLLSARNVRDGYIDVSDVDFVGEDEFKRISRRCSPVPGDVLISCSGTIGRVALVEIDEPLSLVRSVALVRPNRAKVASRFLEYYLRTPALRSRMIRRANASSQANLFQNHIRELPVFLPPMAAQHEFVVRIEMVRANRAQMGASATELDALFTSLQHRAFRGEL